MKRRFLAFLSILFAVFLCGMLGCDSRHTVGTVKILALTDKVEYAIGSAKELDLSGMEIGLYTHDGMLVESKPVEAWTCRGYDTEYLAGLKERIEDLTDAEVRDLSDTLFFDTEDVDFDRKGKYTVFVYFGLNATGKKPDAKFTVRIVDS